MKFFVLLIFNISIKLHDFCRPSSGAAESLTIPYILPLLNQIKKNPNNGLLKFIYIVITASAADVFTKK